MSTIGKNMKVEIARTRRDAFRVFYRDVIGGSMMTPRDDLDVYTFDDGFSLGAYVVPDDEALTDAQWMRAPWLELRVDDVEAALAALERMGHRPFDYHDRAHRYVQGPGGPVFRLAAR